MELHVYDFDWTLFRSPSPPTNCDQQSAWWASVRSLLSPNVPKKPTLRWWNWSVVESARRSIADPNVLAVLMTGRPSYNKAIRYRILELLQQVGLEFDAVYFRSTSLTKEFKVSMIIQLLNQFPEIEESHFWDDRMDHLRAFVKVTNLMGVRGVPHLVC